jgi:SAM-dependent methyltransferase
LPEAILQTKVTAANSVGEMVYRVGEHLAEIIRGDIDPLSIMLQDNLLNKYYQDDMVKRCYPALHRYVQLLQHKKPNMRVLEIGAGTGGATRHVLQALNNKYQQYDFTDISSGFFLKAEEDFAMPGSSIEFKKLNIELDPVQQGFTQGSYDLIIAANVLHATKSMDHTMRNVRSLLKPGGTLLLMEITAIKLYTGLIFGCLPGWWLSEEDRRDNGPQMDRERWTNVLKDTGFSGVGLHYPDFDVAELRQTEIMVSTAVESEVSDATAGDSSVKVRAHTNGERAEALRLTFAQQSGLTANDPSTVLLVLDDGEHGLLEDLSKSDFDALKKDLTEATSVVWLASSSSSSAATAQGLLRTLRSETGVQTQFITLDDAELQDTTRLIAIAKRAIASIWSDAQDSLEEDFITSDSLLSIPRLVEDDSTNEYVMAATSGTGAFDTAAPRFRSDATYLLSGGLGGLGRATTEWIIRNGAKNIAILTRALPEAGSTRNLWHREMLASGADVRILECNVADASALQGTLDIITQELPPIRGVIQGAMTLVDSTFQNMSHETWETALRPKLQGSWNLHQLVSGSCHLSWS